MGGGIAIPEMPGNYYMMCLVKPIIDIEVVSCASTVKVRDHVKRQMMWAEEEFFLAVSFTKREEFFFHAGEEAHEPRMFNVPRGGGAD